MTGPPLDQEHRVARTVIDALVIGAGPAGAAAATVIARGAAHAKMRVWLVERSAWPRHKVCGCCLSPAGVELLSRHDLAIWHGDPARGTKGPITDVARQGGEQALPDGIVPMDRLSLRVAPRAMGAPTVQRGRARPQRATLIDHPGGWAVARDVLDDAMVRRAKACGVEFHARMSARVRRREHGLWVVDLMHHPEAHRDGGASGVRAIEVRARVVIVADGLSGSSLRCLQDEPERSGLERADVERLPGLKPRIARGSWMGVATIGMGTDLGVSMPGPGSIAMHVAPGGYVGVVGLGRGLDRDRIAIAAALDPRRARAQGGPIRLMQSILGACSRSSDHLDPGGLTDDAQVRAWALMGTGLLTRSRRTIALPGLMVVGDAAGYVEPFTGEGMTWAISGGLNAGGLGLEALRGERGMGLERLTGAWPALNARAVARRQRVSIGVRALAHRPGLLGALIGDAGPRPIGEAIGRAASFAIRRAYAPPPSARGGLLSGGVA